jgi:hypothetical protein
MDLHAAIKSLRDEMALVDQAIIGLEVLLAGQGKRRGRPPAWMKRLDIAPLGAVTPPRKRGRPRKNMEML